MKVGFAGLLAIVFIILKLCSVIEWSWIWVLAPLWLPCLFWGVIVVGALAVAYWANK